MTLEAALADPVTSAVPINCVIVGQMIMPLNKVEEMATGLHDFIEQMKAQTVVGKFRDRLTIWNVREEFEPLQQSNNRGLGPPDLLVRLFVTKESGLSFLMQAWALIL